MSGGSLVVGRRSLDEAVVVALGANLPAPGRPAQAALEDAVAALAAEGLRPLARSRWWRSRAWPDPSDPPFLNGAVLVDTALDPLACLDVLHRIEADFGRVRGEANAPRPLDLDLIAHGRRILPGPGLVLPHPRAHERLFVMGPLAEIAPAWRHPVSRLTATQLAAAAPVGRDAHPLEE